jgi:hypothetical protein
MPHFTMTIAFSVAAHTTQLSVLDLFSLDAYKVPE